MFYKNLYYCICCLILYFISMLPLFPLKIIQVSPFSKKVKPPITIKIVTSNLAEIQRATIFVQNSKIKKYTPIAMETYKHSAEIRNSIIFFANKLYPILHRSIFKKEQTIYFTRKAYKKKICSNLFR